MLSTVMFLKYTDLYVLKYIKNLDNISKVVYFEVHNTKKKSADKLDSFSSVKVNDEIFIIFYLP